MCTKLHLFFVENVNVIYNCVLIFHDKLHLTFPHLRSSPSFGK